MRDDAATTAIWLIAVLLPSIILYLVIGLFCVWYLLSRSRPVLLALIIVSSPLWLLWSLSFVGAEMELSAWQRQIFFPDRPVSDIGDLTIAGDRVDSCVAPCAELLLNGRLPKITLWSRTASTAASTIQTVTPNVTDECRTLIQRNGLYNKKIERACFHYQPADSLPDGYVLFVGPSQYFEIEPRRTPPTCCNPLVRYQAFTKRGEQFDEIAYAAVISSQLPAFPPILSWRGFVGGRTFHLGDQEGTFKLLNRIFDFNLGGKVKL